MTLIPDETALLDRKIAEHFREAQDCINTYLIKV